MSGDAVWRILVTDIAWPSTDCEAEVLARVGGELIVAESGAEVELLELVSVADAVLTCWAPVPARVIAAGTRLRVIGRYGIGVDNIDVAEATRRGILVTNVPAYCLDEVSEHAMALLLACARKICRYSAGVRSGDWEVTGGKPLFRLRGRTLGIVGFGRIGRSLASKAQAFGMNVLVSDPHVDARVIETHGCAVATLDALLAAADFVSIHAPLNDSTRGIIGEDALGRMKRTAYIINTARGAIIDTEALVTALVNGWIAGAALDVFDPEPLPPGHPLLELGNVIATPHVSFYSEESLNDLKVLAAENIAAVLSGRRPASVVNPEVLRLARWQHLQ